MEQRGLIVDLFAGGGGASTAIFNATGRHPDVAINHNPDAIAIHTANHPKTRHFLSDIHEVDPVAACTVDGEVQPIELLWASPDCTHFSKARGGRPVEKHIRSLADVVIVWIERLRPYDAHPRLIALENVEEFQDWGPVLKDGKPCPERKGIDFRRWCKAIRDAGYVLEHRELVAADYGAPTTRKRLFLVARRDGEAIHFPHPTHAPRDRAYLANKLPWRAASEIIDWSLPTPSIFARKRALAPATRRRIAKGVKRFVIEAKRPFIVPLTHTGSDRLHDVDDPLRTITTANRGELAVASAFMTPRYGEAPGQQPRTLDVELPYPTVVPDGNGGSLAAVHLTKFSENSTGTNPADPLHTAMAGAPRHGVVAAYLGRQFGSTVSGRSLEDPHPAVMSDGAGGKSQLIAPVIDKYYGAGVAHSPDKPLDAVTAKARFGLAAAHIEQANTDMVGHPPERPLSTIVGKGCTQRLIETVLGPEDSPSRRAVLEFLWEHFGEPTEAEIANPSATVAGRLKFGIVLLDDVEWRIVDIGMRMLTPRELFNAQGFPPTYVIDITLEGKPISKTSQTSSAGNSVSPPPAEALLRANLTWISLPERVAA